MLMIEIVRQDIIKILDEAIIALREKNISKLKEISNHTIHNASVFQDEDSVTIAVLIYALSKILERKSNDLSWFIKELNYVKLNLVRENLQLYRKAIKNLFKTISNIDRRLRLYVQEVINKAKIKKGAKIYYHGISLARAASMLGISQWELMSYIGKTSMTEFSSGNVKRRLSFTRKLFKW